VLRDGLKLGEPDFLGLKHSTGIDETGVNIFKADTRVIAQDLIGAPALGKEVNNEFNRKASPSNDWLTNQDIWVKRDASLLIHKQA
jgi:hypothetical protein